MNVRIAANPGDVSAFGGVLRALYDDLDAEVSRRGPVCELSGRCCRFLEYGHTLFISAPEADLLLAEAPAPSRSLDDGLSCPWQNHSGHCTARDARPLGCRVYFCDPGFQESAPELTETFLARLKKLVEEWDLPWNYAPLHWHLRQAEQEGRLPPPQAAPTRVDGAGQAPSHVP
jgi:hypothetical protein